MALFYIGDQPSVEISVKLSELGFISESIVRDLWNRKEIGSFSSELKVILPAHGSGLYHLK
ncbi:MAG: hypothetical protein HZB98_00640 [Bacteroidia bacterium]|nr:hypothetical protein [Bacteroidia bacterium]